MNKKKGQKIEKLVNNTIASYNKLTNGYWFKSYPETVVQYYNKNKYYVRFAKKGNCDYYGIYQGKYITIEAKQTINKNKFALKNILDHQIDILDTIWKLQGYSFILFYFEATNQICLTAWPILKKLIDQETKKYLKIENIITNSYLIEKKGNILCLVENINKEIQKRNS